MRFHVDLFTGLGGFTLAAHWCGLETVCFCESDERCQQFLAKAWPGIPCHPDVRTFDGSAYRGAFLLTGGVPCQPASRAGKQKGKDDVRWLWPSAIRVLSEVNPTWALFENPPGIGDVGLAGILAEMESLDYQVRVFGIPACAVGAPHRRERYWIVGNANKKRRLPTVPTTGTSCGLLGETFATDEGNKGDVADAESKQNERERSGGFQPVSAQLAHWERFVWLPCADGKLRRVPDNSFGVAHGLHRSVLGALGNSIVPQVAERIIRAMIEAT